MFHCLDDDGKRSCARAVHRATRANANLLMSCFCDANPPDPQEVFDLDVLAATRPAAVVNLVCPSF